MSDLDNGSDGVPEMTADDIQQQHWYDAGFDDGWVEGHEAGWVEGREAGYNECANTIDDEAYDGGYKDGCSDTVRVWEDVVSTVYEGLKMIESEMFWGTPPTHTEVHNWRKRLGDLMTVCEEVITEQD